MTDKKTPTKAQRPVVTEPTTVESSTDSTVQAEPRTDQKKLHPTETDNPRVQPRKLTEEEIANTQSPARYGYPEHEIAQRSTDVVDLTSAEYVKVFVIPKNPFGDDYDDDMHERNIRFCRGKAIQLGLRPLSPEAGEFAGAEDHPDGVSVCLRYTVAVVPAAIATPEQNVVAVNPERHEELLKNLDQTETKKD